MPVYNLIKGIKRLAKIEAVLDFVTHGLTIDSIELPMQEFESLMDLKDLKI